MNNAPSVTIVDDDEGMSALLKRITEDMGFSVRVFNDSIKFQNSINELGDIIFLDLMMPGADGIEVIRSLAANNCTSSLFLISGQDKGVLNSTQKLAKERNLNVVASLNKPLEIAPLQEMLKELKVSRQQLGKIQCKDKAVITSEELRDAIETGQLVLHYQPQIDMKNGQLVSLEALVRWQHPKHGLIYPNSFISLAEANGLIGSLTEEVIRIALNQDFHWTEIGLRVPISINVSAENITSLTLPEQLERQLQDKKLDPSLLVLEITESALMGELVTSLDILTRLRLKGFSLSIDDFGTGFSSLSQLHRVPFSELKVDQSFVMKMDEDDEAYAIVETCVMLGQKLKMNVVAEGVENKKIFDMLVNIGCDAAQGYYIAKPMPANMLEGWLASRDS